MVSLIVFLGLPLLLLTWLSSIWSTLLTTTSMGLLSTCLNHLSLFSINFSTIGVTPTLSNGAIPNPIMFSLTTHPAQHPHLCYTYLILVLTLNRPTLCTIQQRRSDWCPVELSFQLKWYFLIAQNPWGSSPFQPPSLNTMIYICFYFSVILYYGPEIFKPCNLGYDITLNFHL